MAPWAYAENRYGDDKVYDACGLFGYIDTSGKRHSADMIIRAIDNMEERGNGLGAGFAVYGLYPDLKETYALHAMCRTERDLNALGEYLERAFAIVHQEPIPHRDVAGITDPPIVWRYFVQPREDAAQGLSSEEDYVVRHMMTVNAQMEGAFIVSCGQDMGIFKGVGLPDQIAEFYRIDDYQGYMWTAHNRFPTNTPGWWGGAHPFGLLDWAVVHNGEMSSYGTNRRYLEMHGYRCTMRTDTEVVAYAMDLLVRRHKLPLPIAAKVLASPLWDEIQHMPPRERRLYTAIRQTYGPLLLNGPFTVIVTRSGEMMGLGDRIRLRPLAAGVEGNILYVSSELSAIHLVAPNIQVTWTPEGGVPVIAHLGETPTAPESVARLQEKLPEEAYHG